MSSFDEGMACVLSSYRRVGSPKRVAAAVSGGVDSSALLVLLSGLRDRERLSLSCLHVNHGLRPTADDDERHVETLCSRLHVPFLSERLRLEGGSNLEARAREARYRSLWAMAEKQGADVIAAAHQADDQAETVLMHLMYGAGAQGLGGMAELRGDVWRPLLSLRRETLQNILKEQGLSWREDETNRDESYTRNRIRHTLLPAMERIYPATVAGIWRAADILSCQQAFLEEEAEGWIARNGVMRGDFCWCKRHELGRAHKGLGRAIIRRMAAYSGVELSFAQTDEVWAALSEKGNKTINLPNGRMAYLTRARAHIVQNRKPAPLPGELCWRSPADGVGDGVFIQSFDEERLESAVLRVPESGDYIRPLGMDGAQKLPRYLMNAGVDRPFREAWPVLAKGSEILWVVGVGAGSGASIDRHTARAAEAVFNGELPDGRKHMGGQNNGK